VVASLLEVGDNSINKAILERNVLRRFFCQKSVDQNPSRQPHTLHILLLFELHDLNIEVEVVHVKILLLLEELLEVVVALLVAEDVDELALEPVRALRRRQLLRSLLVLRSGRLLELLSFLGLRFAHGLSFGSVGIQGAFGVDRNLLAQLVVRLELRVALRLLFGLQPRILCKCCLLLGVNSREHLLLRLHGVRALEVEVGGPSLGENPTGSFCHIVRIQCYVSDSLFLCLLRCFLDQSLKRPHLLWVSWCNWLGVALLVKLLMQEASVLAEGLGRNFLRLLLDSKYLERSLTRQLGVLHSQYLLFLDRLY